MTSRSPSLTDLAADRAAAGDVAGAVKLVADDAMARRGSLAAVLAAERFIAKQPVQTWARRRVRLALLSSHTSGQLASAIRVMAAAHGIAVTLHESGYRQYEHDIVDESSALYAFRPEVVVLVADQREVRFPELSETPDADVAAEVSRWTGLWRMIRERTGAEVLQTTFVPPYDDALGSLGIRQPGARRRQLARLNLALGDAAPAGVHLVDAQAVALRAGAGQWFDDRYWHVSKHAVGLGAVGELAAATLDVLVAALGLSRKVIVVDLDNTLWGGVVGEDGLAGLELGGTPAGEAYVAFQEYLARLRMRGLVLAVCSKNNPDEARAPFLEHPEMRLGLHDLVAFEAGWDPKPVVLRRIAATLSVGLDALVFVDDNPVEREAVRQELPMVGVVDLPAEPSGYVGALAAYPGLQTVSLTAEDARRTEQYQARGEASRLAAAASSRSDFLASLDMRARVEPLDELNLTRIVQLIGKTNQLNLTTRRHSAAEVERLATTEGGLVWGMRVRDRFDDHGLVAVLIAQPDGDVLDIDTLLMSCRVLGRGVEPAILAALAGWARERGFTAIRGTYLPTERNAPAATVYADAGFAPVGDADLGGATVWMLDLASAQVTGAEYVEVELPSLAGA